LLVSGDGQTTVPISACPCVQDEVLLVVQVLHHVAIEDVEFRGVDGLIDGPQSM
jgi:hypothetical protein